MTNDLVNQEQEAQLPAFMQGEQTTGVEELGQFITPPRLKIVQKMSGAPFDKKFEPGDVVLVPQLIMVAPYHKGLPESFFFTPIFFFPEWCLWNPIQLKGALPAIRERTVDPNSPLVAKSRNSSLWSIPCPEDPDHSCRYVEHLNYVVVPRGNSEVAGMPMIMSFARAEHRSGSNLATRIKMRKGPIFGCNFMATVAYRESQKGSWHGFDIANPATDSGITPFITDEDEYNELKKLHKQFAELHEKSKLRVDYDDVDDNDTKTETSPEF